VRLRRTARPGVGDPFTRSHGFFDQAQDHGPRGEGEPDQRRCCCQKSTRGSGNRWCEVNYSERMDGVAVLRMCCSESQLHSLLTFLNSTVVYDVSLNKERLNKCIT